MIPLAYPCGLFEHSLAVAETTTLKEVALAEVAEPHICLSTKPLPLWNRMSASSMIDRDPAQSVVAVSCVAMIPPERM